ncbi:hypothetical protein KR222_001441 [Zaprionus bogoriensis]|nr:hypothetical protein KR222_001441 [Zaprionus bogoriensis]
MATFQMETRQQQQQQQQQQQRTNLKQRATTTTRTAATITTTTTAAAKRTAAKRRQRQRHANPSSAPRTLVELEQAAAAADAAADANCSRLLGHCSTAASAAVDCSSSSSSSSSCRRVLIMFSMLVVVVVVISGNGVLASQRDNYKSKDMSGGNNAIQYEGDAGSAAAAAANGVAGSGSMTSTTSGNSGSNKNGHTTTDISSSASAGVSASSSSTSSSSSNSKSGVSSATTTISGIASSSLHKANSIASPVSASGINRNSIDLIEDARNSGPYFDRGASKNVTALLGKTAYLNCRVKNLGNKTMLLQVSWVRHRDIHLLTVGRYTYTSDQRFRAIHQPQTEDWMLQIKYPQHRDSGIYECQVSTTPHMSHYIHLTVVEPSTEIIGAPDLYIESGSTINLTCVILNSPEPPAYIFWNHNNAIINYDSPRGGVSVVTNKGETTTSFLLIKSARPSDSGHYQCNPSNAKPKSVTVHVLNGVSHSVSRGVPSSNAARGTCTSPHVSRSLSLIVPICVLLQLGICQALHAALSAAAAAATSALRGATSSSSSSSRSSSSADSSTSSGVGCVAGDKATLSAGRMRRVLECLLSLLSWSWHRPRLHSVAAAVAAVTAAAPGATATFRQVYETDIR